MHSFIKQALAAGIFASIVLLECAAAECSKVYVRREIRDLSDTELDRFTATLKEFMFAKHPNQYDSYAKLHNDAQGEAHGTPNFLPWHRVMLARFENDIRRIDPEFVLPYWDWSIDSQMPDQSPIFTERYFGGNGQGARMCIGSGPYKDHVPYYTQEGFSGCLTRSFMSGDATSGRIGPFAPVELMLDIVSNHNDYSSFESKLEGTPHGSVHNNIGAGFATMFSPNDPLFFVHHAFVDKLWADWQ
ncbi:hypothetical protein SYNPS1DRAFT_13502, partial [Syncephalis pseudoplumigaleata]